MTEAEIQELARGFEGVGDGAENVVSTDSVGAR